MKIENAGDAEHVLAVGDPRRPQLGRTIVGMLVASTLFVAFAFATKESRALYIHTPWHDDPYDAVVSFAIFFVPLVAGLCLLRIPACRRAEPLPVQRVVGLVRGAHVAMGAIAITLLSDWISVALRANGTSWTGATALMVVLLMLLSVVAAKVTYDVIRVSAGGLSARYSNAMPDWLADVVTVAERYCRRLGPARDSAAKLLHWVDRYAVNPVRRHPVAAASTLAIGFGCALSLGHAIAEGGGRPIAALVFAGIGASGMFAFIVAAGSYLGLVRSDTRTWGAQRRLIDAAVIACACVPLAVGFRDSLWWIVGSTPNTADLSRLGQLLTIISVFAFVVVFGAESATRIHEKAAPGDSRSARHR